MLSKSSVLDVFKSSKADRISLSRYFPKGTYYFYAYPSGEASGFLNNVPPSAEELVSARPVTCAGDDIRVVAFANTSNETMEDLIKTGLAVPRDHKQNLCLLPAEIDANVEGQARNEMIKQSLKRIVPMGSLVMAQPYLDDDIDQLYQISPRLTHWLNDKQNMGVFIPKKYLPVRYALYKNGMLFCNDQKLQQLPCVVKVSSSSAGDGVFICRDLESLQAVKAELRNNTGTVLIEQHIEAKANYSIQFGIPEDNSLPIDIIGLSKQLTTENGEFIGGIVDNDAAHEAIDQTKKTLIETILPEVRNNGWYGVGCVDILVDADGDNYIIDCNFRMTGMTAVLMLTANKRVAQPLLSFNGEFSGDSEALRLQLDSFHSHNDSLKVKVLCATNNNGICRYNAVLSASHTDLFADGAVKLLDLGLNSKALEYVAQRTPVKTESARPDTGRKPSVAIFCKTLLPNNDPFSKDYYWQAYQDLILSLKNKGAEAYFVTGDDTYLDSGRFKHGFTIKEKTTLDNLTRVENIKVDVVFNRANFTGDGVTVISSPYVHRIGTNKIEMYKKFARFQPYSVICDNREEVLRAFAEISGTQIVVKEPVSFGGHHVYIGEKSDILSQMTGQYPLLVQEFLDTSGGIPGYAEGVHDIRLSMCGGELISSYIRLAKPGSLHANVAQGGRMVFLDINKVPAELITMAKEIDKAFAGEPRYYAVDFINTVKGWKMLEINSLVALDAVENNLEAQKTLDRLADYFVGVAAKPAGSPNFDYHSNVTATVA